MEKFYDLKEYIISKKKYFIVGIIILIIIFIITFWLLFNNNSSKDKELAIKQLQEIEKEIEIEENSEDDDTKNFNIETVESIEKVLVDVKGEIKRPGLYKIDKNNRVQDVINIAGGLTENADTSTINLSKKIFDEMVIIVYSKKVETNIDNSKKEIENNIKECPTKTEIINDACIKEEDIDGKEENSNLKNNQISVDSISINTATLEEFMKIPGIGEGKANKIIEYRNEFGNFKTLEDIKNVSGIGDSLFEKIKPYIKL